MYDAYDTVQAMFVQPGDFVSLTDIHDEQHTGTVVDVYGDDEITLEIDSISDGDRVEITVPDNWPIDLVEIPEW